MATNTRLLGRSAFQCFRQSVYRPRAGCPTAPAKRPFAHPISQTRSFNDYRIETEEDGEQRDIFEIPSYSQELLDSKEKADYELMSPEERKQFDLAWAEAVEDMRQPQNVQQNLKEIDKDVRDIEEKTPLPLMEEPRQYGYWAEDDPDEESQVEDSDDFKDDDMTSMAHAELEQHRELRSYARIIAWDMPLLSSMLLLFPGLPLSLPHTFDIAQL